MLHLLVAMLLLWVLARALRLVLWMAIALIAVAAFGGPLFSVSIERWLWTMLRGFN